MANINFPSNVPILHENTLVSAINSTVRITSSYDIRDKFNPAELDSQGKSIGSGFFIDDKGHILTCNHVVSHSIKIFINLPGNGKKSYRAQIISLYPELDIAIIKIHDYQNKYYINMGSSDECIMGSDTIAIGYPLGDDTVKTTKGTISGKKDYLIQTDTTVNPGNSGGPLLNNRYEVIGINSSKMTGHMTEGTGYIVPIDIFKTVMNQMMRYNINSNKPIADDQHNENITMIYKPNLYCKFQTLENETAKLMCRGSNTKNKTPIEGYMLISCYKNSPLSTCEYPMCIHDILIEFDGKKLDCYGDIDTDCKLGNVDLESYVLRCNVNQNIKIKYFSCATYAIVDTTIKLKNEYLYQIPEIFYPQKISYIIINGVVICQLSIDHLYDIINDQYSTSTSCQASVYKYILSENREKPKIFISHILPNSSNVNNKNLENSKGCVIVTANGYKVSTICDFKTACSLSIIIDGKKYVHMRMSNQELITMCINGFD